MPFFVINNGLVVAPHFHRDISATHEAVRRADGGIGEFARQQLPTTAR
jgi:hypothetical protein